MGTEKPNLIFPAVKDYFDHQRECYNKGTVIKGVRVGNTTDCDLSFYDLHDGKMLYLLTQHSQWNRRHHPYLLCTCYRGDGVKDESHKCMWLSNEEQINLVDRSNHRWAKKREQVGDTNYTQSMHRDWIDENNKGVSHFGVDSYSLPRHNLRFDIFHMKCSVTKKLMTYL